MPTRSRSILRTLRQYRYRAYSGRERETTLEYQFNSEPPYPEVPKNIFSRTLFISDVAPVEIARQLTLIEFNLFSQVKVSRRCVLLRCVCVFSFSFYF
jgi:hypothetical protein